VSKIKILIRSLWTSNLYAGGSYAPTIDPTLIADQRNFRL